MSARGVAPHSPHCSTRYQPGRFYNFIIEPCVTNICLITWATITTEHIIKHYWIITNCNNCSSGVQCFTARLHHHCLGSCCMPHLRQRAKNIAATSERAVAWIEISIYLSIYHVYLSIYRSIVISIYLSSHLFIISISICLFPFLSTLQMPKLFPHIMANSAAARQMHESSTWMPFWILTSIVIQAIVGTRVNEC